MKVFKTPRMCGYSTRHIRRLVANRLVCDKELLKMQINSCKNNARVINKTSETIENVMDVTNNDDCIVQTSNRPSSHDFITEVDVHEGCRSSDEQNSESLSNINIATVINDDSSSRNVPNSDEFVSTDDYIINTDLIDDDSSDSCNDSEQMFTDGSKSCTSDEDDDDDDDDDERSSTPDFFNSDKNFWLKKSLKNWAIKFKIALVAVTALLLLLRGYFNANLPLDARTLMGTVRSTQQLEICGGEYHHFGLERAVEGILREKKSTQDEIKEIKLTINVDGLPIFNSANKSLWLILCSEVSCKKVYPVGVFLGRHKPTDSNEFLKLFVEEAISLYHNGAGVKKVKVIINAVVCDAPAKSFVFSLKGHTGYNSCSKCLIEGESVMTQNPRRGKKNKRKLCFPGIGPFPLKTDHHFAENRYGGVESNNVTIFTKIPKFGCITSVPLDYLHLILLGVMKKLIKLWLSGPSKVRLRNSAVQTLSKRMLLLRRTIPKEFNRKPRVIMDYCFWKGTEFRTFLLYSGVVVLQNILPPDMYQHFVLLHSAVSILMSSTHLSNLSNVECAHEMLQNFVKNFGKIYGKEYISHNVHNLLHICDDVKKYGVLDNFSTFKFENYMSTIKNMIRKGDKPIQQIARRYEEMDSAEEEYPHKKFTLKQVHNKGPITDDCILNLNSQYRVFTSKKFTVDCTNFKDNCVLLNDGSFCVINNIVKVNNKIRFIGKKLELGCSLYNEPDSRQINIYVADKLNTELLSICISDVQAKVWKIFTSKGLVVLPLLHTV